LDSARARWLEVTLLGDMGIAAGFLDDEPVGVEAAEVDVKFAGDEIVSEDTTGLLERLSGPKMTA